MLLSRPQVEFTVCAYCCNNKLFHEMLAFWRTRSRSFFKSVWSSGLVLFITTAASTESRMEESRDLSVSDKIRLILFLVTAFFATLAPITNPKRLNLDEVFLNLINKKLPWTVLPCLKTSSKSFFRFNRFCLGSATAIYTVSCLRPFCLLRASTLRPFFFWERARNPCFLCLFFFFGR